ncbi:hypothetical protein scyTo_0018210 [Scyliorhinus torazame]|uniref:Ig-like domain-containing protein n=1 Tax=Scyliorhinus torazame TaxID=75743 RepID=A0A401PQI7_SCYTO|nr:hypothetical protein [Scyliorhinus torazame]
MQKKLGPIFVLSISLSFIASVTDEEVTQTFPSQNPRERKTILIHCHTTIVFSAIYWYVQPPNQEPKMLIMASRTGEEKGRFRAVSRSLEKSSSLTISSLSLTDTATYFCVVSPTQCCMERQSPYKNLGCEENPNV